MVFCSSSPQCCFWRSRLFCCSYHQLRCLVKTLSSLASGLLAAYRLYSGPAALMFVVRFYNGPPHCWRPPVFTMVHRLVRGLRQWSPALMAASRLCNGPPLYWRPPAFTLVPRFACGRLLAEWSPACVIPRVIECACSMFASTSSSCARNLAVLHATRRLKPGVLALVL